MQIRKHEEQWKIKSSLVLVAITSCWWLRTVQEPSLQTSKFSQIKKKSSLMVLLEMGWADGEPAWASS